MSNGGPDLVMLLSATWLATGSAILSVRSAWRHEVAPRNLSTKTSSQVLGSGNCMDNGSEMTLEALYGEVTHFHVLVRFPGSWVSRAKMTSCVKGHFL